eukprot:gene13726-15157_t
MTSKERSHTKAKRIYSSFPQRRTLKENVQRPSVIERSVSLNSTNSPISSRCTNNMDGQILTTENISVIFPILSFQKAKSKANSAVQCCEVSSNVESEVPVETAVNYAECKTENAAQSREACNENKTKESQDEHLEDGGFQQDSGEQQSHSCTDNKDTATDEDWNDVSPSSSISLHKRRIQVGTSVADFPTLPDDISSLDNDGEGSWYSEDFGERMGKGLCEICYVAKDDSTECLNCNNLLCKECIQEHVKTQITEGFTVIYCPAESCVRVFSDNEVEELSSEFAELYIKNKVDTENNPRKKTCPGCNKIHSFPEPEPIPSKDICSNCSLHWCVKCHAPWHIGMNCAKYQKDVVGKGKKALKVWAKSKGKKNPNARKCPHCRFFIERSAGCDHMCCTR